MVYAVVADSVNSVVNRPCSAHRRWVDMHEERPLCTVLASKLDLNGRVMDSSHTTQFMLSLEH